MPTVAELIRTGTDRLTASGSESPRLDAELLLARILRTDRTSFAGAPRRRAANAAPARAPASAAIITAIQTSALIGELLSRKPWARP